MLSGCPTRRKKKKIHESDKDFGSGIIGFASRAQAMMMVIMKGPLNAVWFV